uniref:Uncharacterized protein n=1 Tax=Panagrolaimus sp. JU765 TaxID=591449 RepID=A0AC34QNU6_9BILA
MFLQELTRNEVENLFETLNVNMQDEDVPLNTILIWGATDMTHYAIEKIFAEYHPHIALKLDNQSYVVQFKTSRIAAKMFIGMSKKLKRVRQPKNFEEGEIEDSDEEKEGQIIADDDGEQVELVQKLKNETELCEEVQFDITKMKIPKGKWRIITKHVPIGKWRIITKHVPIGKTLLAKYAHITEIKKAMNNFDNIAYRQERVEKQKSRNRLKPGINVFDSAGNELPWDFEHDTRIFNDPSLNVAEDKVEEAKEQIIKVGDQEIRSRGRGTRKVVTLNFSSDEDDNESEQEEDDDNANEPWDFEHDTRIFNDPSLNVAEDKVEEAKEQIIKVGDQEIRSRGRGTRKVVTLNFSSDEEDDESEQDEDDDNANEVSKPEPSQKPSDFFRTSVLGKK